MGEYASLQLFKAPGITNAANTPNFLRDLSYSVYQAQWTDLTQGGAASAQFDCRKDYGDIVDILFHSFILWGYRGAQTSAVAHAGDGTLTVTNLMNAAFPSVADIIAGDIIMVTDGANTELFSVGSVTGSSPTWTLHLNSPGTSLLGLGGTLLNGYASGSTVVRLHFQGFLSQRVHSTAFDNQFSINASGFFNRYTQMMGSYNVQAKDGGTWLYTHLLQIAGGAMLAKNGGGTSWPIGTTTFGCSDLASLLVGENISIGIEAGNREDFVIDSINVANGTFTTHVASTKVHNTGEVVSPKGIADGVGMQDLIVPNATVVNPSGVKINLQTSDQPVAESIAAVVRQETGSLKTQTWACWADVLRQVNHQKINSAPPNMGETKMTIDAPPGSTTFHVANISRIKVGRRVFITGAAGMDSLKVTAIHSAFNSFDTAGASTFDHPAGDKVVIIYDVTPGFTISQSDGGSAYGDTINKIQTTDMDGTQLINAAIVTGTVMSQNGQIQTTLSSATSPGDTHFSVVAEMFQNGDTVTIVSSGGVNTENVTITADPTGSGPYTYPCTAIQFSHAAGRPVVLASGSGAGPKIIVFESDSIADNGGYFEGQLTSSDITDKPALLNWAKEQIEITAWPLINAAIDLDIASCRIDGRTLLGITGFSDGVPLYINVIQVQYQWLAAMQNATASIQAGYLKTTSGAVLKELANRHAIRDRGKNPRKNAHNFDGHMAGGEIIPNADNTFALNATTLKYGGAVYQLNAVASQAAPEGVSYWGVDLSNPATPVLNTLPSMVMNGRRVYAEEIWQATDDDGVAPTKVAGFTGLALWKVEVRGGQIFGVWPLFATEGVALGNLPSFTTPAPTASSATPTAILLASGEACDLTLTVNLSNLPQDESTHEIKYYLRTNGTSAWSHKFTRKISGLPLPGSTTLADAPIFHNIPAGITIDIGASYAGTNGESSVSTLVTGYALPAISGGGGSGGTSSCTESTQAVVTSATQVLASNSSRIGVFIANRANSNLYVGTDNTTTSSKFMAKIGPRQTWQMPVAYTGAVWVIWDATDSTVGAQANIAAFPS